MSLALLLNYLAMRLDGPRAAATDLTLNLVFTDSGERAALELRNGALNHSLDRQLDDADATVTLTRAALSAVVTGEADLLAAVADGTIAVAPASGPLETLVGLLDRFDIWFNVVEP